MTQITFWPLAFRQAYFTNLNFNIISSSVLLRLSSARSAVAKKTYFHLECIFRVGFFLDFFLLKNDFLGRRLSLSLLVVDDFLDGFQAPELVWEVEGFEDEREGRVVAGHTLHGGLQVEEAVLLERKKKKKRRSKN